MSQLFFLETKGHSDSLYPFTLMRALADMPLGILTLRQKWNDTFAVSKPVRTKKRITLASGVLPEEKLCKQIWSLPTGRSLFTANGSWIATADEIKQIPRKPAANDVIYQHPISQILFPWDLLTHLTQSLQLDFSILTKGKRTSSIPKHVVGSGKHPVFIEKGAILYACCLNTENGPIYIGKDAVVQEGCLIRGPFALGASSVLKMGTKIYGPVAAGEGCLLGGEIKRSLIFPFSNKAHDGYMGDSVIGSWCNWGAGTSNSNLKNTAGTIRTDVAGKRVVVGQKAGVFMGDHSRTAINTSLNSGSVFGVSVQLGNEGLSQKRLASFRWMDGKRYRLAEALNHIRNWKSLKGREISNEEIDRLTRIYKTDK